MNSYTCKDHGHDWEYTGMRCWTCGGKFCRTECARVGCDAEDNSCVNILDGDE